MRKVAIILGILAFPAFADDLPTSGSCAPLDSDSTCAWSFDADTNTLSITGQGKMANYGFENKTRTTTSPWFAYTKQIQNIIIENGITNIGQAAFYGTQVENIKIPNSVTSIGTYAFFETMKLKNIGLPDNLEKIGHAAFYGSSIISLDIPDSVILIDSAALASRFLKTLTISDKSSLVKSVFWAGGGFIPLGNLQIYCKGNIEICRKKIEEATNLENHPKIKTNFNIFRENRRIYTIGEAEADSRSTGNIFSIRYR